MLSATELPIRCLARPDREHAKFNEMKKRESLSVGQLAVRWALSSDRIHRLIDAGKLPGAFRVPSAGRYGEAVRIPLSSVEAAETKWSIAPNATIAERPPPRPTSPSPLMKHFPELNHEPHQRDVECREDERH